MTDILKEAVNTKTGATIFGFPVKNPKAFGVVEFDKDMNVLSIEENHLFQNQTLQFQDYTFMITKL